MADPPSDAVIFRRPVALHEADGRGVLPSGLFRLRCPYGVPGDRLWVRETLRELEGEWFYAADNSPVEMFESDPRVPQMLSWAHHKEGDVCVSIHMPRWASRIALEVTDVRVERLKEISESDARAEGMIAGAHEACASSGHAIGGFGTSYRAAFFALWDAINAKRAPWSSNPWVWVVEFKRA